MNERVGRLRRQSYEAPVTLSTERAEMITDFYQDNLGKHSVPVMRALAFEHLCRQKTIHIGKDELIVGERGPKPKAVPTYPELTCHSEEDLHILNNRPITRYAVDDDALTAYRKKIIPFWRGRTMRDRIFEGLSEEWKAVYDAGIFTEFMEQRAPGHTTLDGKFYSKGLLEFKKDIEDAIERLDFATDPEASSKRDQLRGMAIACDAAILFANRHADAAEELAVNEKNGQRKAELERIASNCRRVPAHAPRDFWEALQMYWFMHLGTITELNGWDAMNPGHLDRYFYPFYAQDLERGVLTRESAKELLECFWIKFNNHPAPPKVGVTAEESGTYNDFTNINLGGVMPDGTDGVNELSYLMLEVMDDIHLLQPQGNIQLSRKNPDRFLKAACRVIRKGYGYPSVFNADGVVEQLVRSGKKIEDARDGGTSGCVETGAFGKEAYILTGYLNTPKIFEITLHNGVDPRTGNKIGLETGEPRDFKTFDELFEAFRRQLGHFVDIKIAGNQFIERMYATQSPAVFLSVLIDDCIDKGRDYNDGGPRYNTNYIQCVGIGTITDSLAAIRKHVFEDGTLEMTELLDALRTDYEKAEPLRLLLANKTPRYGNDDDYADGIMMRVFDTLHSAIDGRPNTKGGRYHIDMLPTTCHIYFGSVLGATPDGRRGGTPVSEGISPVQGADRKGPTAVVKSVAKMDHLRTGGTLLNMKFLPTVLDNDEGIDKLAQLVRTYFRLDGHHVQFNVVDADTLRHAQTHPEEHRDLIVRVAGYSDYFCDLGKELQDEIIRRTEHEAF
ncbi:MAG: glycyl radical protein [Candidatus Latescibacterota bacterium]|nr:MAG: glycyl radical protein [Candidatus Latescibacterota bacterium]